MKRIRSLKERFWEKVNKRGDDECWEWTACKKKGGYGIIGPEYGTKKPGVPLKAHRVSWELKYGPIPEGMCVCHKCDNPPCVNPNHLFLATNIENTADKMRKGRFQDQNGEKNPNAKLNENDVSNIREDLKNGKSRKDIAAQYGLDVSMISRISTGSSWSKGKVNEK